MNNDAAWLAAVFDEHSRDLLIITDAQGVVMAANQRSRATLFAPPRALSSYRLSEVMSKVTFGGQEISQQVCIADMPGYLNGDELAVLKSHTDRIFYGLCRSSRKVWRHMEIAIHSISPLVVDPFEFARQRSSVALPDTTLNSPPFLLEVAHEIKNTLHVILGLLEQSAPTGGSPQHPSPQWHRHLSQAAQSLTHLARDMGDISRLQRGDFTLRKSDFDLHQAFESLIASYRATLQDRAVRLDVVQQTPCHRVHGDEQRILQIAKNLIDNAIRFTDQGVIRVLIHLDEVGSPSQRLHLRLRVQDTGVGLPDGFYIGQASAQHHPHHPTAHASTGGSGIGLALCERLCHLMDGKISARNAPGGGALFEVSLFVDPCLGTEEAQAKVGLPPQSAATSAPLPLAGHRILLVDDAQHCNEMTAMWLREAGAQAELCADGHSAWQRLSQEHFDLVLMDARLPRMSGAQATRAIRQLPGSDQGGMGQVPIIGLTGQSDAREVQALRESGMNGVLSKPISRAELLQVLQAHLGQTQLSL